MRAFPLASLSRAGRALAAMSLPLICVEGVATGFARPDERLGAGNVLIHSMGSFNISLRTKPWINPLFISPATTATQFVCSSDCI